jgi:aminoglycoside phosphotransferase family enzyme
LRLNRRLASDVYLDVVPLVHSTGGMSLGGPGETIDWLVVMRRLDERCMLDHAIAQGDVKTWQLDRLIATLVRFYRHAKAIYLSPAVRLTDWRRGLAYNRRVLLDPRLGMPGGLISRIDAVQRRFLESRAHLLGRRIRERRLVDGHGDLRPEHICLGDPVRIIDCIEFNPRLRAVDPFDEIAFLGLECERLGAPWIGTYIEQRMKRMLQDGPTDELLLFYRCHRAMLRARLAIAHLLEPNPRTPEKWPTQARAYLTLAASNAVKLQRALRTRAGR